MKARIRYILKERLR